jgi:hypothetical protein
MPFPDEGGDGNDVIFVDNRPAYKDVLTCGDGLDRVLVDRKDEVAEDCERVAIGQAEDLLGFGPLEEAGFFEEFEAGLPPSPKDSGPFRRLKGQGGWGCSTPRPLRSPIHQSAWKGNSAKFRVTSSLA